MSSLEKLYASRCQVLVPLSLYSLDDGNYQLIGSHFETAVNLMLSANWPGTNNPRFDQPYFNTHWIDYVPPAVTGETVSNGYLSWNATIWSQRPTVNWSDWGSFSHFEVYKSTNPDFIPDSTNLFATDISETGIQVGTDAAYYKVLAVSEAGLRSIQ